MSAIGNIIKMNYNYPDFKRISVNPEVCFGKPCIRDTRMPVASILSYLSSGMNIEDFLKEFNWITREDVLEALAFASYMTNDRIIPLQQAS